MDAASPTKLPVTHLISTQAWVFGALDDEDRAPIYWTNALVYLLPWLSRGFELDRFSIACLVAGVIHIQVRHTQLTGRGMYTPSARSGRESHQSPTLQRIGMPKARQAHLCVHCRGCLHTAGTEQGNGWEADHGFLRLSAPPRAAMLKRMGSE